MDTILSLPLKMIFFSVINDEIRLKFESNSLGWFWNRYIYEYECKFNTPQSFGELITGQTLLDSKIKIRVFLVYTNILNWSTPGQCVAIMYDGQIALKGTEEYKQFKHIHNGMF